MKKQNSELPKRAFIYVYDYDNGKPLLAVAESIDEIPEECDGNSVATYFRDKVQTFKVQRELR